MKKSNKFLLSILALVLTISITSIPFNEAKAIDEKFSKEEWKKVEELTKAFEFIDKVTKRDSNGHVISMDFKAIEKKYGKNNPMIKKLKSNVTSDLQYNKNTSQVYAAKKQTYLGCMKSSLYDFLGVNAVNALFQGGFGYFLEKKLFKEAAKLAVKYAVGATVGGLAATLSYYGVKCAVWR